MNPEKLIDNLSAIKDIALKEKKEIACLISLESSGRHMTGIYFKSNGNNLIAYFFDTTGLTFPAYPCGGRIHGSENPEISNIFAGCENHGISIAIMPINTARSVQKDHYSCLMATLLFFISVRNNHYQILDHTGIVDSIGEPAVKKLKEVGRCV